MEDHAPPERGFYSGHQDLNADWTPSSHTASRSSTQAKQCESVVDPLVNPIVALVNDSCRLVNARPMIRTRDRGLADHHRSSLKSSLWSVPDPPT